jgi:hypothetical protein
MEMMFHCGLNGTSGSSALNEKKTTLVRIRMFETYWGRALIQNISQQPSIPIVVVHNDANLK